MTTYATILAAHARRQPTKLALVAGQTRLTYAELDDRVARVATRLARAGVCSDDVVSSQLANCAEALVLAMAVNRLGAVHNPITTIAGAREIEFVLGQAVSRVYVDTPDHELLRIDESDDLAPVVAPAPRARRRGSSCTRRAPPPSPRAPCTPTRPCSSSARHSPRITASATTRCSSCRRRWRTCPGLIYGVLLPVFLGATSVLLERWDPTEFLAAIERERGTFSGGATPFLQGAVDHPDLDRFDLSTFRLFPCGGADVPPDLIRRARSRLGVRTGRGYGSTEFPSITSSSGPDEPDDRRAETDGRPIGENRIRIVDGEVEAIGPEMFLGYLDGTLDADAFTADGWLRTGDLGTIDADGYLTIIGRAKDVVIRYGEKIPAKEVESVLAQHPSVDEVAVVALPDPRTGERACACIVVVRGAPAPTLTEVAEFCLARGLAKRRLPEQIEIVDALPRTPGGKVDKRALVADRHLA